MRPHRVVLDRGLAERWWWRLAVVAGARIAVALLTAIPPRLGAVRSPAEVLRSE